MSVSLPVLPLLLSHSLSLFPSCLSLLLSVLLSLSFTIFSYSPHSSLLVFFVPLVLFLNLNLLFSSHTHSTLLINHIATHFTHHTIKLSQDTTSRKSCEDNKASSLKACLCHSKYVAMCRFILVRSPLEALLHFTLRALASLHCVAGVYILSQAFTMPDMILF